MTDTTRADLPALPEPDTHCWDDDARKDEWSYSKEMALAYGAACYAAGLAAQPAQPLMINGLTEAATSATASCAGLVGRGAQPAQGKPVAWQERQEESPGVFCEWYDRDAPWSLSRPQEITSGGIRYQFRPLYASPPAPVAEQGWICVNDRLPEPGKPVLVACGRHVMRAVRAPKFTLSEDAWGNFEPEGGEYDEATDATYWPEGWYEWNQHEETHWQLDSEPTYWHPLPPAPAAIQDTQP